MTAAGQLLLKDLSAASVVGAEPVSRPVFALSPPDFDQIWSAEPEGVSESDILWADDTRDKLLKLEALCRTSLIGGYVLSGALVLGFVFGGIGGFYNGAAGGNALLTLIAYVLVLSPIFSVWVVYRYRSTVDETYQLSFRNAVIMAIVIEIAGAVTVGLGYLALPLFIGLRGMTMKRPLVWSTGHILQNPKPYKEELIAATAASEGFSAQSSERETRIRTTYIALKRQYDEEVERFAEAERRWSPYSLVQVPDDRDVLVVGGTGAERAVLAERTAAAMLVRGSVWVIDAGEGRSDRRRRFAGLVSTGDFGHVDAVGDDGIVGLLDGLGRQNPAAFVEVLAAAFSHDAGVSGGQLAKRQVAQMLRRIARIVSPNGGPLALGDLHQALQVLLGRARVARGTQAADDFGLGSGESSQNTGLTDRAVEELREEFTADERTGFLREWSNIRDQLASLQDEATGTMPAAPWGTGLALNLVEVGSHDDRVLRTSLIIEHHLQVLKDVAAAPACIMLLGADDVPAKELQEISRVAESRGIPLYLSFQTAEESFRQLARGRRAIVAMGGLGAEAAEQVSGMFGKGWTERVQSYQAGWSTSDSLSRAESAGRSWNFSEGVSESSSRSSGAGGRSSGSQAGWNESESWGTNDSTTDTRGLTTGNSGNLTTGWQYEERARGDQISRLPAFTMLLKLGSDIQVVDFNPDLVLPVVALGTLPPAAAARVSQVLGVVAPTLDGLVEPLHASPLQVSPAPKSR